MHASFLPGQWEWIIVLIIALLIFGKRLPGVMRSMGQSLRQFKKGMEDVDVGLDADIDPDEEDDENERDEKTGGDQEKKPEEAEQS